MQELLRHSTLRSTLDVYTQAVTPSEACSARAQAAVVSLVLSSAGSGEAPFARQDAVPV
jgi:integrase